MDMKQFANVDTYYKDLDTGQEIEWKEYMSRIIRKLGIENIRPYLPYSLEYLKEKLKTDIHLNNTSIREWDEASGFRSYINNVTKTQAYFTTYNGLPDLLRRNGITCFSVSDCVCLLKETARLLCEQ